MLVNAVSLLVTQLNRYIRQAEGTPPGAGGADPAVWGNIAQLDTPEVARSLENQLVVTLVGLEEEQTLKNGNAATREPGGDIQYRNPPLYLNLLLLFSSNYRNYETALKRLAQVLAFFQGKRRFTPSNSPAGEGEAALPVEFSLTMELLSPGFEDINHLWGSLGGKQLPFALYRGRLVSMSDELLVAAGGPVREIGIRGRDFGA